MFDPDTDARRMLVRERHDRLALDALRPEPARSAIIRSASRSRRRRLGLRWPALRLGAPVVLGAEEGAEQ